jgi:hypothetical protein
MNGSNPLPCQPCGLVKVGGSRKTDPSGGKENAATVRSAADCAESKASARLKAEADCSRVRIIASNVRPLRLLTTAFGVPWIGGSLTLAATRGGLSLMHLGIEGCQSISHANTRANMADGRTSFRYERAGRILHRRLVLSARCGAQSARGVLSAISSVKQSATCSANICMRSVPSSRLEETTEA